MPNSSAFNDHDQRTLLDHLNNITEELEKMEEIAAGNYFMEVLWDAARQATNTLDGEPKF